MSPCTEEMEPEIIEVDGEAEPGWELEFSRREFLAASGMVGAAMAAGVPARAEAAKAGVAPVMVPVSLMVNGKSRTLTIDTRTSLLDVLREQMELTGSKKGCDHGQCGACTVLLDGRRVNACLTLAVAAQGAQITTIEGLGQPGNLSAGQQAFLEHDAFQCGYCTPGQICSATALVEEARRGDLSVVSFDAGAGAKPELTDREIRERMSGNICRCGAYPNIVAAVRMMAGRGGAA